MQYRTILAKAFHVLPKDDSEKYNVEPLTHYLSIGCIAVFCDNPQKLLNDVMENEMKQRTLLLDYSVDLIKQIEQKVLSAYVYRKAAFNKYYEMTYEKEFSMKLVDNTSLVTNMKINDICEVIKESHWTSCENMNIIIHINDHSKVKEIVLRNMNGKYTIEFAAYDCKDHEKEFEYFRSILSPVLEKWNNETRGKTITDALISEYCIKYNVVFNNIELIATTVYDILAQCIFRNSQMQIMKEFDVRSFRIKAIVPYTVALICARTFCEQNNTTILPDDVIMYTGRFKNEKIQDIPVPESMISVMDNFFNT